MPSIQDIFKNDMNRGLAIGVGAALVAVAALPVIVSVSRPFARSAIKSGLLLLEKGRETMAEMGEDLEDLVAEVKAELAAERQEMGASMAESVEQTAEAGESS